MRAALTSASKTRVLRSENLASSSSSRAKMRTMREPVTFSSAVSVTSAIFCCTSRRIGCRRRLKRTVTSSSSGRNARLIKASCQFSTNISTVTATIEKMLVVKKMRP